MSCSPSIAFLEEGRQCGRTPGVGVRRPFYFSVMQLSVLTLLLINCVALSQVLTHLSLSLLFGKSRIVLTGLPLIELLRSKP